MPIQAYVRTAASNLRQAAQALSQDIANVRQQIAQEERERQDMLMRLRQRRRDSESEVSRTEDQTVKQQKAGEIAATKQQEVSTDRDKDAMKRQLGDAVNGMERLAGDLNRYASELESLAARVQ